MNDVDFDEGIVSYAIFNGNYELIHLVESNAKKEFEQYSLYNAVKFWHHKIANYIIDKVIILVVFPIANLPESENEYSFDVIFYIDANCVLSAEAFLVDSELSAKTNIDIKKK